MSLKNTSQEIYLDDRLAVFTDDVLVGKAKVASDPDKGLLQLKQTILRLKNAYPSVEVGDAQIKQMYVRFKNRTIRDDIKSKQPIWREWLDSLQTRPMTRLTAAMVGILLFFVFLAPVFSPAGSSITASAVSPVEGSLALCVGSAVIILCVWIVRRK